MDEVFGLLASSRPPARPHMKKVDVDALAARLRNAQA